MHVFTTRGIALPKQGDQPQRAPSPEATPHAPASHPTALSPLGAPGFPRVCSSGASARSAPSGPCTCAVRSGLTRGIPGGLCSQRALQVGRAPSSLHTPPRSGHHASVSHSVNYPACHPCVNIPSFHKHAFTYCRKTYKDLIALIIFLRMPSSSVYLVSFHFLLISGTWLYKN